MQTKAHRTRQTPGDTIELMKTFPNVLAIFLSSLLSLGAELAPGETHGLNVRWKAAVGQGEILFSPTGLLGFPDDQNHWTVRIVETGEEFQRVPVQDGPVITAAFSAFSRHVALVQADAVGNAGLSEVEVWDLKRGELRRRFETDTGTITKVAFHENGSLLASGDFSGAIRIWDLTQDSDRPVHSFRWGEGETGLKKTSVLAFHDYEGGKALIVGGGARMINAPWQMWDIERETLIAEWPMSGSTDVLEGIISRDKKYFLTLSGSRNIEIWRFADSGILTPWHLELPHTPESLPSSAAFWPRAEILTVVRGRHLEYWEPETGHQLFAFPNILPASEGLSPRVAFSSASPFMAYVTEDHQLLLSHAPVAITQLMWQAAEQRLSLEWVGPGGSYQVHVASSITGPWETWKEDISSGKISEPLPDQPMGFFRVVHSP